MHRGRHRTTCGAPAQYISWRHAPFIGVGAMVDAGIFSLLGAAGEVAGSAVWLSFLLAGIIAGCLVVFVLSIGLDWAGKQRRDAAGRSGGSAVQAA